MKDSVKMVGNPSFRRSVIPHKEPIWHRRASVTDCIINQVGDQFFFVKWTEPRIHGFLLLELYNVHSMCPPIRHAKKLNRFVGE